MNGTQYNKETRLLTSLLGEGRELYTSLNFGSSSLKNKAVFVNFVAFRLSNEPNKARGRTNHICPTIDFCSVHVRYNV
jgi:hypothetical protein